MAFCVDFFVRPAHTSLIHCSPNKITEFVRGRLVAAQPLATKEPYGCGVPFTGAAHTAEVCFVSVGHGDSAVPL